MKEKNQFTKLKIKDFLKKPKSSLIILMLLLFYIFFNLLEKCKIKIKFSLKEKIITNFTKLSEDKRYLLNKLNCYSKPISKKRFKFKSTVEVHSIVSHLVLPYYIIMVKSLQYFSQIYIKFIVHEDGSLTKSDILFLHKQLQNSKLITYKESTEKVKKILKNYPCLLSYRIRNHINKVNLMTTVDVPYFSNSEHVLYVDGDILFFNKPKQLCEWLLNKKQRNKILYTRDHSNCYVLSKNECRKIFKVSYLNRFNMGILAYEKDFLNLKSLNYYFSQLKNLKKDDYWGLDQTYFMIYFQKLNKKLEVLYGKKYLVYGMGYENFIFVDKRKQNTISCHYTSTVRDYIYKEAIIVLFKMKNLL